MDDYSYKSDFSQLYHEKWKKKCVTILFVNGVEYNMAKQVICFLVELKTKVFHVIFYCPLTLISSSTATSTI